MVARALMLQGTGSDVGKSLLVTGLARVFTRRGLRVRPFKPQNMSNNAAVTENGGEIGRAQALQARACGIPASTDMTPVLLKQQSDGMAQLVGTYALLSPSEQARLTGYIVNKFRGDPRLFDGGVAAIGERTGLPCFGVVPYLPDAALLPAEDSMALSLPSMSGEGGPGRS